MINPAAASAMVTVMATLVSEDDSANSISHAGHVLKVFKNIGPRPNSVHGWISARLEMDCVDDLMFKRVSKTKKLSELEDQLQQLQGLVSTQKNTPHTDWSSSNGGPSTAQASSTDHGSRSSQRGTVTQSNSYDLSSGNLPSVADATASHSAAPPREYTLEPVTISESQAQSLFSIYFHDYHRFLPFLEPQKGLDAYYSSSSVLFWAIVAVAARQYRADADLLSRLTPVMNNLLWCVLASEHITIAHIQALTLCSFWPLPTVMLSTDKSMILNNIAITSAMHLGVHKLGREAEYAYEGMNTEFTQAQVGSAFTLATAYGNRISFSVEYGHAPTLNLMDVTVDRVCDGDLMSDFPAELRDNLLIQRFSNRAFQSFYGIAEGDGSQPWGSHIYDLMISLENGWSVVAQQIEDTSSFLNKIRLYSSKLHIQCLYFVDSSSSVRRTQGILKAYGTARNLISILICQDDLHAILPYASIRALRAITCAATVVFRVLNSSIGATLDWDSGRILYNAAAHSIRQLSLQNNENDVALRASDVLHRLWKFGERDGSLRNSEPTLSVKSRMGANMIYDSLLLLREYQNAQRTSWNETRQMSSPDTTNIGTRQEHTDNVGATSFGTQDTVYSNTEIPQPYQMTDQFSGMSVQSNFEQNLAQYAPQTDQPNYPQVWDNSSDMGWGQDMTYLNIFGFQ
ncbi:hypothetical protein MBLNU459_g3850t1 [Dothideomycetes sp. NU459]